MFTQSPQVAARLGAHAAVVYFLQPRPPLGAGSSPRGEADVELSQRPELRHKVTLSPQVYQGLNILAMPIADLQQLIEVEMLENPVLEVDETENEPSEEEPVDERDDERSWDEWLEMYEDLDTVEQTAPRDPERRERQHRGVRRRRSVLRRLLARPGQPAQHQRAGCACRASRRGVIGRRRVLRRLTR